MSDRLVRTAADLDALPVGAVVGVQHHGVMDVWLCWAPYPDSRTWKGLEVDPDDGDVQVEGSSRWLYYALEDSANTVTVLWSP